MQVTIDGEIYRRQVYGGISRIFTEVLPRMCDLDPELQIKLIAPQSTLNHLPTHNQIHTLHPWRVEYLVRPYRIWKPYYRQIHASLNRLRLGSSKHKIWHSTYYTVPSAWAGTQVVSVYDLIHEFYSDYFPDADKVLSQKKQAISLANFLITISKTTAQDLCNYYHIPESKVRITHLASSPVYRQKSPVECNKCEEKPFLLYVGKRKYYKGFEDILHAFAAWKQHNEIDLLAIGSQWLPEESKLLTELKLHDHVRSLSGVDNEALCDLYNQAVAFIYPSHYEGFGIPLLEAMACGCPIVASKIPSTVEVAEGVPYYFEPGNIDALTAALDQVVFDQQKSARVEMGFELNSWYSWDKTARATLDVYQLLA